MDILNTSPNDILFGNVGQPSSGAKIDHFTGVILHYDGFSISAADRADWPTFLAALQDASIAALPMSRVYPIHHFNALTDSTPAPETKTSGYGNTVAVIEKPHTFEIELEDFGILYGAELRKFNDKLNLRAFFVTPQWVGGELADTEFQGFEVSVKLKQPKIGNVADYTKYMLDIQIVDPVALSENLNTVPITKGVKLRNVLKGCLAVNLTSADGSIVKAVTAISKTDMYDNYADALAVVGAWKAVKASDGTEVTITAVTKEVAAKGWSFASAYTGDVIITLADPTALAGLTAAIGTKTAGGFESDSVTVTLA